MRFSCEGDTFFFREVLFDGEVFDCFSKFIAAETFNSGILIFFKGYGDSGVDSVV